MSGFNIFQHFSVSTISSHHLPLQVVFIFKSSLSSSLLRRLRLLRILHLQVIFFFKCSSSRDLDHHEYWIIIIVSSSNMDHHLIWIIIKSGSSSHMDHHLIWIIIKSGSSSHAISEWCYLDSSRHRKFYKVNLVGLPFM